MSRTIEPGALQLPQLQALRYVQPLREGGSLPAIVDTDDGLYVVKFRGAGQGAKALLAELLAGLLARRLSLPVPDLALVDVAPVFGRSEPNPEIQDILRGSHGVNVGIRYLDGAFNYDAYAAGDLIDADLAAAVVWFDALLTNPDRTHRNPNLLIWKRHPHLIDHGAALYVHHDWASVDDARTRSAFPLIGQHVLLTQSGELEDADARLAPLLDASTIDDVVALLPDTLLTDPLSSTAGETAAGARARYRDYLLRRLEAPRAFVTEAARVREAKLREPPRPLSSRR